MLNSKLSNNSWLGDQDDEDDPFAQLEEGLDEVDLEANIARDKYARLRGQVEGLVSSLKTSQDEDVLGEISEQLLTVFCDLPETKNIIISAHGMLPILEILDICRRRDIILCLLRIVNAIIFNDYEIQENLCFVGGIPIINEFASKKYPREIRLEAAAFVQQMYQTSTLTLQMFVSAGGLNVLVEFLEDDYEDERDLVLIGVNGIWSVFDLQVCPPSVFSFSETDLIQGSTPKNDFCRILSRNSVLDPLSLVLSRVLDEEGELAEIVEGRIANIFFIFSQAENHVKEMVAERTVLHSKASSPAISNTLLTGLRGPERAKADDARTPDHYVEVHQEFVHAFNNSRLAPELQRHRRAYGLVEVDHQTAALPGSFQPDSQHYLQYVSSEQVPPRGCCSERHSTASSEDRKDRAAAQRVRVADSLRHGAFRKGRTPRTVAQQGSGFLHLLVVGSVLAGNRIGRYIYLVCFGSVCIENTGLTLWQAPGRNGQG